MNNMGLNELSKVIVSNEAKDYRRWFMVDN